MENNIFNKQTRDEQLIDRLHRSMDNVDKLISAIAYATGRLDIVPYTNEGKLCVEVREYLLNSLKELKYESNKA